MRERRERRREERQKRKERERGGGKEREGEGEREREGEREKERERKRDRERERLKTRRKCMENRIEYTMYACRVRLFPVSTVVVFKSWDPPGLLVPLGVLRSKHVHRAMVTGHTDEGRVLVEVDAGRGRGRERERG